MIRSKAFCLNQAQAYERNCYALQLQANKSNSAYNTKFYENAAKVAAEWAAQWYHEAKRAKW